MLKCGPASGRVSISEVASKVAKPSAYPLRPRFSFLASPERPLDDRRYVGLAPNPPSFPFSFFFSCLSCIIIFIILARIICDVDISGSDWL